MIHARYLPVAFLAGLAFGSSVLAQAPSELANAIQARDAVRAKADATTWGRLTIDEYVAVMPSGAKTNKPERLAAIRQQSASRPFNPPIDESVRMYRDTAVRRLRSGNTWVLELWVRSSEGWRVAESQQTAIAP